MTRYKKSNHEDSDGFCCSISEISDSACKTCNAYVRTILLDFCQSISINFLGDSRTSLHLVSRHNPLVNRVRRQTQMLSLIILVLTDLDQALQTVKFFSDYSSSKVSLSIYVKRARNHSTAEVLWEILERQRATVKVKGSTSITECSMATQTLLVRRHTTSVTEKLTSRIRMVGALDQMESQM